MLFSWKTNQLKRVCSEIIDCVNKTAPVVDYETPYKMIRTTNVKNGRVDLSSVKYVTKEIFEIWTRRIKPKKGDIILTREAPLGEVGLLRTDDNIFLGQRLIQYRTDPSIMDQLFLYYAFQEDYLQGQLRSKGSGATVEHLRIGDCENINVKYPPLPIQRKIASILSTYDELIEINKQRVKLLEEIAEEIYKEWFVRMRFPGYEITRFFDEEGNEVPHGTVGALPEGWREDKAETIFNINIGKTPPREESHWFTNNNNGIKWISIRDMNNTSVFVSETSEEITKNGVLKFYMNVAKKDTVIVSFKLTVGEVRILIEDMVTNEAIAHFNIIDIETMNREYTYYYLKHFQYSKLGNTSSIGNAINSKIVKKLTVIVPSKGILKAFKDIVNPFLEEIKILLQKTQLLQQTRDLLLPRLISGKLSVEHLLEPKEDVIKEPDSLSTAAETTPYNRTAKAWN